MQQLYLLPVSRLVIGAEIAVCWQCATESSFVLRIAESMGGWIWLRLGAPSPLASLSGGTPGRNLMEKLVGSILLWVLFSCCDKQQLNSLLILRKKWWATRLNRAWHLRFARFLNSII